MTPGGGEECHPGVDAEGAGQAQELADKTARAWQPDIGKREHHEAEGVKRHAVDEPAIGGDLAGMHAVVDHADERKSAPDTMPCESIWKMPPCSPCMVRVNTPMVTKPIWATEE